MTTIIGIGAFVALALAGWAICELKDKGLAYTYNDEETAALNQAQQQLKDNGYSEQDISDVIRNISTKGYKAC